MSTQSNVVRDTVKTETTPSVTQPTATAFLWLIRRELWENRSVYLAPLAVGIVFFAGFLVTLFHLPGRVRALSGADADSYRQALSMPYDFAAGLAMLTCIVVGAFYCLDALYGERRDRSILFWKSLPVSDLATVLSKAVIPLVILPVITYAVIVVVQFSMLLVSSVVLAASGLGVASLWEGLSFPRMAMLLLYHLITVHALWPAPVFGWFLLVSAWAKRAPVLWAVLPMLVVAFLEKIVFESTNFIRVVAERIIGGGAAAFSMPATFPTDPMTHITPVQFLGSPSLWIGFLIMAGCLAAAVRVRRSHGPI